MTKSIKYVFCGECFVKVVYLVWNEWVYEVYIEQAKIKEQIIRQQMDRNSSSKPSSNQALTTSAETGSPAKAAGWTSQLRTLFGGHIWVIFHNLKSILKIL